MELAEVTTSTDFSFLTESSDLEHYFDLDSGVYFEEDLEKNPYCSFKVDSVYEKNRKRANREIFRNIANGLRVMKNHAKNGFRNLSREEQIKLITHRENQGVNALRNGSFYTGEVDYYDNKIRKKVKSIYEPLIKWRRN